VDIVSREAARAAGRKRYFTGEACRHGHVAERFVSIRMCTKCASIRRDMWRDFNPDKVKIANARPRNVDKVKARIRQARWRAANKDQANAATAVWQRNNPGTVNANTRKRQAKKLNATPPWLTSGDHDLMRFLYQEAAQMSKDFGTEFEVDHIIPLQGKVVCGLHVPWNLRVVARSQNRRKSSSLPSEEDFLAVQ
jgi:5-methylcytosine-specific restriction endonuclease McrA